MSLLLGAIPVFECFRLYGIAFSTGWQMRYCDSASIDKLCEMDCYGRIAGNMSTSPEQGGL
jgi:hypothetical protein